MDSDYENEEVIVNFEEESGNLTNEEEMEKENGERVEFNTKGRKKKPKKDDSYKTYSYGDIVMFIGLVEEREEIWNPRNKDWHRNEVRKEKFAEVEQLCKRKSAVDRFEMEGKVVSFISSLRGRGGSEPPTTHLSHSSIFPDHNLLDLDNYGPSSSRSFY